MNSASVPTTGADGALDILFVVTGLTLGGAESQVTELALAHATAGRRVGVMALVPNGTLLRSRLAAAGIEVMDLGMRRGRPSAAGFARAALLVRRHRPRVVHAHMFHSNILARALRLVSPIPLLVCTAHNSYEGGRGKMLIYRATSNLGDVLTNVSEMAARELERRGAAPRGSIVSIWNGIDTGRFRKDAQRRAVGRAALSLADGEFAFLAAGRLTPQKDYPTLMVAMREVVDAEPTSRLFIAGQGELAGELMDLSRTLGLGDNVRWLGERDDIDGLMNAADAFVLSSAYEGFGLVVAEAMASELPVIATRCNGPEEVLGDSRMLVPVRCPVSLADAMIQVVRLDPEKRLFEGATARARVMERFSLPAVVHKWVELYATFGARL